MHSSSCSPSVPTQENASASDPYSIVEELQPPSASAGALQCKLEGAPNLVESGRPVATPSRATTNAPDASGRPSKRHKTAKELTRQDFACTAVWARYCFYMLEIFKMLAGEIETGCKSSGFPDDAAKGSKKRSRRAR